MHLVFYIEMIIWKYNLLVPLNEIVYTRLV